LSGKVRENEFCKVVGTLVYCLILYNITATLNIVIVLIVTDNDVNDDSDIAVTVMI